MKKTFYVVLLLSSITSANVDSIFTVNDLSFIDSLLYNGELGTIKIFLNNKDQKIEKLKLSEKQISEYSRAKTSYLEILKFCENLKTIEESTLDRLIEQFNSFEERFELSKAGEKSNELYQKFKLFNNSGERENALKFYRISYYFKLGFIRQVTHSARISLKTAYNAQKNNNPDKAQITMSKLLDVNNNIQLPSTMIDSLFALQAMIESSKEKIQKNKHFWKDDRVVNNFIDISIGTNFIHQNEVVYTQLKFNHKSENISEIVNLKYVPDKFVLNYTATIEYRILNSIFIGLDLNYSEFIYSSKNMQDLVFFDFKLNNYSSHLFFKFQSRKFVGLRPYLNLGAGYFFSVRKKTEGIIVDFPDDINIPPTVTYYYVPEKNYRFMQIIYETGLDYLPSPKIKFIFGTKLSLYQNINFNDLIGQFNFALGTYLGYWF